MLSPVSRPSPLIVKQRSRPCRECATVDDGSSRPSRIHRQPSRIRGTGDSFALQSAAMVVKREKAFNTACQEEVYRQVKAYLDELVDEHFDDAEHCDFYLKYGST